MTAPRATLRAYYLLAKPGIVYGNTITAAAGFFLAARGDVQIGLLLATLVGIALVIASACVFNNYIDRGIDTKMARTKGRALAAHTIPVPQALTLGTVLGLAGLGLLALYTNLLTTGLAVLGMFFYLVMYSIGKRRSVHGTVVGSISGAVPIVVGYCAVVGRFDAGAVLLFLVLVAWQMPHFYAIAIYREGDYAAAHLPVLPIVSGIKATKYQMLSYIVVFIGATTLLTAFGYTGYSYLAVMLALGLAWLKLSLDGFKPGTDDPLWARRLFRFSLLVLMGFSAIISLDVFLP